MRKKIEKIAIAILVIYMSYQWLNQFTENTQEAAQEKMMNFITYNRQQGTTDGDVLYYKNYTVFNNPYTVEELYEVLDLVSSRLEGYPKDVFNNPTDLVVVFIEDVDRESSVIQQYLSLLINGIRDNSGKTRGLTYYDNIGCISGVYKQTTKQKTAEVIAHEIVHQYLEKNNINTDNDALREGFADYVSKGCYTYANKDYLENIYKNQHLIFTKSDLKDYNKQLQLVEILIAYNILPDIDKEHSYDINNLCFESIKDELEEIELLNMPQQFKVELKSNQ